MRVKILTIVLVTMCAMSACEKGEDKPEIPRDKMISIVTELHMAEVYSSMVNDSLGSFTNKNIDSLAIYYSYILKSHDVSAEQFKQSMNWYSRNVSELDTIYINVLSELSTMEGLQNAVDKPEDEDKE